MSLTFSMQQDAQQGEWESVREAEAKRQKIIQSFFGESPSAREASWLAEGINKIMEIDREIILLGREKMDLISKELKNIDTGQKAGKAYRRFA